MRSLWALNALMLHDVRSYILNLRFCNSFFLIFDWPLENNGPLFALILHDGRSYMV